MSELSPGAKSLHPAGLPWGAVHHMQENFRNRLIWGDNKLVMASLLKDFRGKVDLREMARQAMTDWIRGLRRIWRAK